MIKKKILILSMVAIMLNVPMKSYSYSLNNIQLATNSDLTNTPSGGGGSPQPPDGGTTGTPSGGAGNGSNGQNKPLENKGSNSVELDGGIGEWGSDKDNSLPDFDKPETGDKPDVDNEPEKGEYFTISATVPLGMEFLIKNKDKHGFSTEGIFISPYYKASNPYVKKIDLVPPENSSTITSKLLKSTNSVEQVLGLLDPNEQARLYYGSDLWETPKSENVEKGVEANFNLKLAFSIEGKTTETNQPSGSTPDTSPSQPPNGTTPGDTSQSSQGSSTQGQQPNGDTSSEVQNPAGNGQQGQRN